MATHQAWRKSPEWRRARRLAIRSSDLICYLCGLPVDEEVKGGPYQLEVDHIFPASRGGALFELDNLAVSHELCNDVKGDKTLYELRMEKLDFQRRAASHEQPVTAGIDWLEGDDHAES